MFTKKIFAFLFSYLERYIIPDFYAIICKESLFVVSPYYRESKLFICRLASLIAMSGSCFFKKIVKNSTLITIVYVIY